MHVDLSYLTQGIENEKIINLTFQGDIKRFGNVGDEYKLEDAPIETRSIRDTTASKHLVKGSDGYAISQGTIIDSKNGLACIHIIMEISHLCFATINIWF